MPTDQLTNRVRPELGEILNQDGKVYVGTLNPNGISKVKYLYKNEKGDAICSAFRTNGQKVCTTTVLMENGRCRKHGGASHAGVAHYKFKTGRFSKHLPARLTERYEEALADDKLADFTEDLAIVDARLDDLFQQMDAGGGREIFTNIKEAYTSFKHANQDGDSQAMRESLRRLDLEINRGSSESFLWTEIRELQEQRRKIILAQAKHLQLTNQTITVTKVNLLISALLDAVRSEVSDANILNRISQKFLRIMNGGAAGQLKS